MLKKWGLVLKRQLAKFAAKQGGHSAFKSKEVLDRSNKAFARKEQWRTIYEDYIVMLFHKEIFMMDITEGTVPGKINEYGI